MYYGTNLATNEDVEMDRTEMPLPHRAIFGIAGSGTNTLMKQEMIKVKELYPEDSILWIDFYNEFFSFGESLQDYGVFRMEEMLEQDAETDKVVLLPSGDNYDVLTLFNIEKEKLKEAKKKAVQILLNTMEEFKKSGKRFWIFFDSVSEFLEDKETAELMWDLFKRARTADYILTFTESSFFQFTRKEYGLQILGNIPCVTFLRQYRSDCDAIQNFYHVPDARNYLLNAPAGAGLIYLNEKDAFVPFHCEYPRTDTTAS